MNIQIKKTVNVVNKDGVEKHYSNYVLVYGELEVPIKPVFADKSNYKLMDFMSTLSVDRDFRNVTKEVK